MRPEAARPGAGAAARRVQAWLPLAAVVVLFCLPLFVGLGRTDLGNDEAIYSFGVDVILETGDWLTPRSSPRVEAPFLEKPPLKFWIVALPIRLGLLPHNEFGLRFWDALMGAAAFVYVFAIGRRLAGPVCGVVAVLTLFTHAQLVFVHGLRSNNMESALLLAYCGGVYHFLAWRRAASGRGEDPEAAETLRLTGHPTVRMTVEPAHKAQIFARKGLGPNVFGSRPGAHVVATALYFLLGFMTKFVAAIFLPLILVAASLLTRRERVQMLRAWRAWLMAGLLVLALAAPWFVYQHLRLGSEVWEVMFGAHVFTRFTSYVDPQHLAPWHFYVLELGRQLRASQSLWLVLAGAAALAIATIRRRWPEGVLVLAWFALPVTLISLGSSKIYHYLYPFLPPVALAAAYVPALIAGRLHARLQAPLARLDAIASFPSRFLSPRAWQLVRVVLYAVAAGGVILAVITWALGSVRFRPGDVLLVRNSGTLRPLLVTLVALALAGRARRVMLPLLVVAMLPLVPFRNTLARLPVEHHPLRSARDCLNALPVRPARGVYVESPEERLYHYCHYYLRRVGPWERAEQYSDERLYRSLYEPSSLRPVLVWEPRYQEFKRQVAGAQAVSRAERAGAPAGPASVGGPGRLDHAVIVAGDDLLLLLPGSLGEACGATVGQRRR